MSCPNCGSVIPNGWALRKSWICCQSVCADAPAINPTNNGMPIANNRIRRITTVR